MWYHSLRRTLSSLAGPAGRAATRASRKRSQRGLRIDPLEDRTVPALTVSPTGTVTLDESAGLQNDDTAAALPAPFSDRLTALGAAPATAINAAVSNGNAISITGATGTITNLAFTDASGNALAGASSGLSTTAGEAILLYTDPVDDNILLGKTAGADAVPGTADDAIALAVYLEETGTPVSGGKFWSIEYKALRHPVATNPDDPVNLPTNVKISATEEISFGFAGAPSGSNLFMTFGNPTSTQIVVIGQDPLNQSEGGLIGTKDVLNISQAGSTTSFGVNGNQINPDEGAFITYVSGTNPDFLVPNLDQNEADEEAKIAFQDVVGASAASFTVNQTNPGVGPVTVKITAYSTAKEPGIQFVDGLTNDTMVRITSASVVNFVVKSGNTEFTPVATVNADGTLTVTGLSTGDQVRWTTSGTHTRVLIENISNADGTSGNDNNTFDIGGFSISTPNAASTVVGTSVVFEDDGPSIAASATGAPSLTVDETDLTPNAGGSFAAQFTPASGADGAGGTPVSYALTTPGGDSGLTDTATGQAVVLSVNGGVVEGRTAVSNALVFTVSVDGSGNVTLDQLRAVVHANTADPDDSVTLALASLVALTGTATDKDGDSAAATLDIGQLLVFEDDGPSVSLALNGGVSLTVDETTLSTPATQSAATLFSTSASFGADGAAAGDSSVWSVAPGSNGADSGLVDVATNSAIFLFQEGATVVGRVGSAAGAVALTVSIDAGTGAVTLTQPRALKHPNAADPDDVVIMGSGLINVTRTLKDGDLDPAAAAASISQILNFKDDGPTITVGDATGGTFSGGVAQGVWSQAPGSDGFKSLSMTLNSYAIGGGSTVTVDTSLGTLTSVDDNGNYVFQGSITADFTPDDGIANAQEVKFILTFSPTTGTYTLKLTTPPDTIRTFDTSQGTLKAGGPDAVQTLLFGGSEAGADDIVFFGAVANAPTENGTAAGTLPNDLEDLVVVGASDLDEAGIEAYLTPTNRITSLINSSTQMNVSTSGIGINNNNLNGDRNALITSADESFVVNPETVVDAVTVFIDNSVGGYNPATEDLYYTVYYTNGDVGAAIKVTADMLTGVTSGVAAGGVKFTLEDGPRQIDAVQLTMGRGTIKIPVIQFSVKQTFAPQSLKLNFTATVTDGDADSSQDTFASEFPSAALTAAAAGDGSAAPLTRQQVRAIQAEAFRRWNLTGLTAAERKLLRHVRFQLADLGGLTLGTTTGRTITLDRDAAGNGWFVDKTPRKDTEFTTAGNQGEQGKIDLLTAVMHEMGHVLGRGHEGGGVMADTLATGVRLSPVVSV